MKALFLLFCCTGILLCIALGSWQIKRLNQKTTLLQRLNTPIFLSEKEVFSSPQPAFLHTQLNGTFLNRPIEILSYLKQTKGYKVYGLFKTHNGYVNVFCGFRPEHTPLGKRKGCLPLTTQPNTTLTGFLQPFPNKKAFFLPDNTPPNWMLLNREDFQNYWGVPLQAFFLHSTPPHTGLSPINPTPRLLPLHHLLYSLTWFLLAGILVLFTAYWWHTQRK